LIGLAAWRYGKKTERPRTKWLGLALMFYPYVVTQTLWMYIVGIVLCGVIVYDRG
jgi:chromate transport protein ChrA